MDAVTYPDPRTMDFIERHIIAHRVDMASRGAFAMTFRVQYTPTVIILDGDGFEHHRSVGFLPPAEFVPFLMLGSAKTDLNAKRFNRCLAMVEGLISEFPQSKFASEAKSVQRACLARGH